ncbi:HNH endonuclease [Zobellia roscoffensis]|uniref:hypothetical protein n=1 Tax=Zobellia roscoffensis TaxID=2779508 RepID=UPI00188B7514|nr:hypothetical protein [Zobellia roscoffensis]
MISLKIDSSLPKAYYKLINTSEGNYKSVSNKLQSLINSKVLVNPNDIDIQVLRDIKKKLKKIIVGSPKHLESLIKNFEDEGYQNLIYDPVKEELTALGKEIKNKFNYKSFRQSKKANWLATKLNVKSCTSCNTQYTLSTTKKSLFHFDHYFPQSIYPYLSLSYYNLIPCCANCNMSKSNKKFLLKDNIHPYLEGFNDVAEFQIEKENLLEFLINPNKNEVLIKSKLELRAKYFGNQQYEAKLENYIKEFRIAEQYGQFNDVVAEMYLKSRYYDKSRRNELRDFFKSKNIIVSDELIRRFIIGNYTQDKDLLKRPLAKFMKDIGKGVGLIK